MRASAFALLSFVVVGTAAVLVAPGCAQPHVSAEPQRAAPLSLAERGRRIAEYTGAELPDHVGNGLRCTSCHLNGGTTSKAASWVGVTKRYPQYRARSGKVDTIEERVNDCFERSMNGKPIDPGSDEMHAIVAYMDELSRDAPPDGKVPDTSIPLLSVARPPDVGHGKELYAARCQVCHGKEGEGVRNLDGQLVFPPLGGAASFNVGAGMARQRTAAGFIRHNMPVGQAGTLTDDEAWDLAGFVESLPRPDFAAKHLDWPKGGKPVDARY